MARYRTTFTSLTSPEAAFDYLSRFSTTSEWDPGVVEARDLTPDPVGLGSTFEVISSFLGRRVPLRYEIVKYQFPRRVVLRAENSSVRSTDTITCEAGADGTTVVSYEAILEPRGPARAMAPVFALLFRRIGDRAAAGLRAGVDRLSEVDLGDTRRPA